MGKGRVVVRRHLVGRGGDIDWGPREHLGRMAERVKERRVRTREEAGSGEGARRDRGDKRGAAEDAPT